MRKLVTFVAIIIFPVIMIAQTSGKISGTVTSEDGKPLAGANVVVIGTSFGAATDDNGVFFIHDVPTGSHSVRVDFIGYKSLTFNDVRISGGLTTTLDFKLSVAAVAGEAIEVVAERPLVEISATNAVRSMDSEQIKNFATRNVNDLIAIQAGVVSQNGLLHIRGSRPDEVGYELEGASTKAVRIEGSIQTGQQAGDFGPRAYNLVNAIPEALEQIAIQSGGYSADLGGANAGIVQQTLKTGGSQLSAFVQYETDAIASSFNETQSYGHQDITVTVGGPITPKIRFFGALESINKDDWNPQFWNAATIANGKKLPDLIDGLTPSGDSLTVSWGDKINGRTQEQINFNGTLLFDFNPLVIRAGGTFSKTTRRLNALPVFTMFNQKRLSQRDYTNNLLNLKTTYFLSSDTYLTFNLNRLSNFVETYDPNFDKESVADFLSWGDSVLVADKGLGTYKSRYTPPDEYNVFSFEFARPGDILTGYSKTVQSYIGANGGLISQKGNHELKLGFDWRRWTVRSYDFNRGAIKSINQQINDDPSLQANFDAEDETAATLLRRSRIYNIGYDEFGNELDDGIDGAKHPTNLTFYVNDKIETKDLIVNAGIRVDKYDLDDLSLVDPENPPYNQTQASAYEEGLKESTPPDAVIQPRLGLSFPLSEKAVFHLQYGKFAQFPDLAQPYKSRAAMALNMGGQNFIRDPLGFDLEPIITTQFEVGYAYQIGNVAAFDVTAFAKNTEGQLVVELFEVPTDATYGSANFTVYNNGDFTTVSGIEFTVRSRRINNIETSINYTYTDARGTNSFPNSNIGNVALEDEPPTIITPLRYEQKHRGAINVDLRFGPKEGGFFANSGMNLLFTFNSGHPYTLSTGGMGQRAADEGALLSDADPRNRLPVEPMGASTTPWYFNTDLRADKSLFVGGIELTAYLIVENLFNREHIVNVYNRSGNAYDDGFLTDPQLSEKIVEAQGDTYVEMYNAINLTNRQHWIEDHGFDLFGTPRQVKFGLSVSL